MTSRRQQLEAAFDADLQQTPQPTVTVVQRGQIAGRRRDPTLFLLAIDRIQPDEGQARQQNKANSDPEIRELAQSIKDHGVLQPLDVRYVSDEDYYKIVAGERRYTAAKLARLTEVPVKVLDVPPEQARQLQLIENIHRADLLPTELASALQSLRDEGHSVEDLANLLRKSPTYISKALAIAEHLAESIQKDIQTTPDHLQSMEHLYELSQLPEEHQQQLWQQIKAHALTSKQLRTVTAEAKRNGSVRRSRRGRPAGTKPYSKTIATASGVNVTIRFRKSRATTHEVISALHEAITLLSA